MDGSTIETIKINFEHLSNLEIPYGKKIGLNVNLETVVYEFILNLNKPKDKLLIIGTEPKGYLQDNRAKPYFEKYEWEFEQSVIFYNDPTYNIDDSITAGFCIGTENNYYLEKIIKILEILIDKIDARNENILFYGSSIGGFTSLLLSTYFKDSMALSDNPKLYAYDFKLMEISLNGLESIKDHCFSNMSADRFIEKFNYRFSFIETMIQENYIPNAYIILNYYNYFSQYSQFFKEFTHLKDLKYSNTIKLMLTWNLNASSLNKYETINLINNIFLNSSKCEFKDEFNEILSKDTKTFSRESILRLLKYNTGRIDLKFEGDNNKINILDISDNTDVSMPDWLNKTGGDGMILINHYNSVDIKLRCIGTGNLLIKLRGVDFRDKFDNRIPIYIKYTKFLINGIELLNQDILTWHDEPFVHIENIDLSKILNIHIEWTSC